MERTDQRTIEGNPAPTGEPGPVEAGPSPMAQHGPYAAWGTALATGVTMALMELGYLQFDVVEAGAFSAAWGTVIGGAVKRFVP